MEERHDDRPEVEVVFGMDAQAAAVRYTLKDWEYAPPFVKAIAFEMFVTGVRSLLISIGTGHAKPPETPLFDRPTMTVPTPNIWKARPENYERGPGGDTDDHEACEVCGMVRKRGSHYWVEVTIGGDVIPEDHELSEHERWSQGQFPVCHPCGDKLGVGKFDRGVPF